MDWLWCAEGMIQSGWWAFAWTLVPRQDDDETNEQWKNDSPDQVRFFMERLVSKEQVAGAQAVAADLRQQIDASTAKHDEAHDYLRKVMDRVQIESAVSE